MGRCKGDHIEPIKFLLLNLLVVKSGPAVQAVDRNRPSEMASGSRQSDIAFQMTSEEAMNHAGDFVVIQSRRDQQPTDLGRHLFQGRQAFV